MELAIISHHDLTSRLEENDIDALVNVLPCAPSRRALDNQCRQLVLWRRFRHKVAGEIRVDNVNSRHTFTNRSSTLIPVTQRKRVTIQDVAAAQRNAVQARPHTGSGETPHYASRMKRDEVTTRELEQLQHEEAKLKAWHNPLVADMVTPKDILRTTMKAVTGFRNLTGAKSKKLQPRVKGPGGSLLGLSFDLGRYSTLQTLHAHGLRGNSSPNTRMYGAVPLCQPRWQRTCGRRGPLVQSGPAGLPRRPSQSPPHDAGAPSRQA